MYMFVQRQGGAETWECVLASERDRIIREEKPAFHTVLDVDNSFTEELSLEDQVAVKYSGPFYADFDGDIEEVLGQVKILLLKLQEERGLDPEQVRWYFTGGRGVHLEAPIDLFLPKPPRGGIVALPHIYKEIALSVYVDTLDLRTYSSKKGRQWRSPNVRRDNGLYKVQVTAQEVMEATPESYERICSAPRAPLPVSPPSFNPKLGLLYAQAKDKVEAAIKKRKSKRSSQDAAKQYEGQWPDSVRLLMSGEGVKAGLGWNQIALQLASFALAIGKTEDETVDEARGLIDTHAGDSDRYGTPRKRERELRNQYRYQDGSVTYEFSLGGIKSLFAKGAYNADLDRGEFVPDPEDEPGEDVTATPGAEVPLEPTDAEIASAEEESRNRLKINASRAGLFMKTDDGWAAVSAVGVTNPTLLRRLADGEIIGYEVEVYVDRRPHGKQLITMSSMTSKANLQQWLSKFSASISAPDQFVPQLIDYLRLKTKKDSNMLVVSREGVDVITPPTTPEEPSQRPTEIIFSSSTDVKSLLGTPLRFRGVYDPQGAFKTDLWSAPDLQDTEETREYFDHLWEINSRLTLGKLAGWFAACFMCQPIREAFKQFPSLQSWGAAGSGKSKSTELFSHMHYWRHDPKKLSSTGSTFFPIMAAVTQSASIPVLFDEYKPREMSKHNKDLLTNIFRNNYEGGMIERGTLKSDAGNKEVTINSFYNVAPIGFIGEAVESQSAIQERCVAIAFTKSGKAGRADHFDHVFARRRGGPLSSLGKSLAQAVMASSIESISDRLSHYKGVIRDKIGRELSDDAERPLFNMAVLLTAHDLLKSALESVFGTRYDGVIQEMQDALLDRTGELITVTMSEAAKVLDIMAQLTRVQDLQFKLEKGVDYTTDEVTVDIKLKPAFAKYVRYRKSLGMEVLYDNEDAFVAGMRAYPGQVSDHSSNQTLRRTPFEKIFSFSCATMQAEGVEAFFDM